MIIKPKARGFICTTAHPDGCRLNIQDQINTIKNQAAIPDGPKKVLIIGASTGYGMASRIVAAFGCRAQTIGVFFEKAAAGKRTASAGWYNTAAFEQACQDESIYAKSINGDAFSREIKQQTIDLIKKDWQGGVDLVIYSLASPRRTDPDSGQVFQSTLKTIGQAYDNKTVDIISGDVSDIHIDAANPEEIENTTKVMGGEDWQLWIDALLEADVLAPGATTVAYSYIGPALTYPIYRHGTIGRAKLDLEKTARTLNQQLNAACQGHAYVAVNKCVVTQASAAIPVVPLYTALLFKLMKANGSHEDCIEQIYRLFAQRLYTGNTVPVDDENRIRIDERELDDTIQSEIEALWSQVNAQTIENLSDLHGVRDAFYNLFGFSRSDIDYEKEAKAEVDIPSLR
ncbi:MAG: enoyl-ACP reductase FabV [Pseudomonadota bacterium]